MSSTTSRKFSGDASEILRALEESSGTTLAFLEGFCDEMTIVTQDIQFTLKKIYRLERLLLHMIANDFQESVSDMPPWSCGDASCASDRGAVQS